MKIIKSLLLFSISLGLLWSCAPAVQISKTQITGSWKVERVTSVGGKETPNLAEKTKGGTPGNEDPKGLTIVTDPAVPESSEGIGGQPEVSPATLQAARNGNLEAIYLCFPEFKFRMEFNADNTVILSTPTKNDQGVWKLTRSGQIRVSGLKSLVNFTLSVEKIDGNSMVVSEVFYGTDLKIRYRKGQQ
jgi:hypothetical protein